MKQPCFFETLNYKVEGIVHQKVYKPPYEKNSTTMVVTRGKIKRREDTFTIHDNIPLKLKLSPEENIEEDVIEVRNYMNLWKEKKIERIFLVGNNIFKMKYQRLIDIADLLHQYFPNCKTIGCFSRVEDIQSKTDFELNKLNEKGYDKLTIQMDINENKILKYMKNGYESDEIVNQCLRLEQSKINYNVFYEEGKFEKEEGKLEIKLIKEICSELHPINILTSICKVNNL